MNFGDAPRPGIVALVGCGGVGGVIARHLAPEVAVKELRLADADPRAVDALAKSCPSPKMRSATIDVRDPARLLAFLEGATLVINAAAPSLNDAILAAACEAGADYIDLAANSTDPYAHSHEVETRGTTAVVGMGEDPGLSNVLARYATDRFVRVRSIRIRDGDTATAPGLPFVPLFSPETFIEETLHPSRIWREGHYDIVPPFGEPEAYTFPAPVGPQTVYSVDHEEVDSIPRFVGKPVSYVDFKLALDDSTVRILQTFRDLKLFGDGASVERTSARKALLAALPKPAELAGRIDGWAALVVEVEGDGEEGPETRRIYSLLGHREAGERFGATATSFLTGTPASAAALLILEGRIHAPGLHPPEVLAPEPFFPVLRRLGLDIREQRITSRPLS